MQGAASPTQSRLHSGGVDGAIVPQAFFIGFVGAESAPSAKRKVDEYPVDGEDHAEKT